MQEKHNHSKESMEWLAYLQKQMQDEGKHMTIQDARSALGEISVTLKGNTRMINYKVDGYFEFDGKKFVCGYNGCKFHGCLKCFPRDRITTMNDGKSMYQRYK